MNIINEIWRTGKFPEDWHKAVIIPIPKPGKDKTEAMNYRPIALTSCKCKTMERMINDRLVWFLESNNLISGNQAGFRKNYSTNDHLVRLESFIHDAFIKKEHCVAIFFDLEKAYDATWKSIYTDGSKQDEKVACAVISPNFTDSIRLPDNSSSFTAEAKAIDIALYHIRDQSEKQFIIYSDSLSVLRSLKNLDHRNPLIQQILRKYNYLSSFKEIVFCWLPSHTNIRGYELADLEAKSALSLSINNLKIPHSDFKSNIHQYVMNKCQSVWEKQTANKLHESKPELNSKCSFLGYSRQNQTKITRCRIGHTRLTHAYLLTNDQPPFCISCNEPFTVKHFLITCTEFNYIRIKYYAAKTIKELFSDTSTDKFINFLKKPTFLTSCN